MSFAPPARLPAVPPYGCPACVHAGTGYGCAILGLFPLRTGLGSSRRSARGNIGALPQWARVAEVQL